MQNANEGLTWREAASHLGPERTRLDGLGEALDHRQRDIGLEQRHAHVAQGLGHVIFGHTTKPAQALHGAGEALGEFIEHGARVRSGRPIQPLDDPL